MKRVDDTGGQTLVKEKSEDVVAVMTGGFKSYFYIGQIRCHRLKSLEKQIEAVQVIGDGEDFRQNLTVRVDDVAVVLVLGDINANVNRGNPSSL